MLLHAMPLDTGALLLLQWHPPQDQQPPLSEMPCASVERGTPIFVAALHVVENVVLSKAETAQSRAKVGTILYANTAIMDMKSTAVVVEAPNRVVRTTLK